MPVNSNEDHLNRHVLAMGKSGSGKSYWMMSHRLVKQSDRVIVWDPYQTHNVKYYSSLKEFARVIHSCIKKKQKLRIGLSVNPTKENFEFFCRCIWSLADGNVETVVLVEELADVSRSGGATGTWGNIIRVGRKYGLVIMAATQRPQDIDKTLFTQVAKMWCGYISNYDQPYVERNLGLKPRTLSQIKKESYHHVLSDGDQWEWGKPGDMKY